MVKSSALRLASFFMLHLTAGQPAARDRRCRLQLQVFNAALILSLGLMLLSALGALLLGQLETLLRLHAPGLLLFGLIFHIARRHFFLIARVGYLLVCHLMLVYGIFLYGKETNFTFFFLHLALFPFLLFRSSEWRWIVISSLTAFVLFQMTELNLIPTGTQPLQVRTTQVLRCLSTLGSFIGITVPALLLLWQSREQQRKAMQRQRAQATDEKLTAIGGLAGGAAHEIHSPLAVIRLTLDNLGLVTGALAQPIIRLRLQKAYDATHRIHHILQKLRATTQATPILPEPLCVNMMAHLIMQRCKRYLYNHGIQLNVNVELACQAVILCHQQHVMDAVDSLINNALEATLGHRAPMVSLTLRSEDEFFQVQVEDTGPGVSEEVRQSIFTPFFTTKDVGSGLGLSLYNARCMARQYGGDLTCRSGPGGRFCLSLPIQKLS